MQIYMVTVQPHGESFTIVFNVEAMNILAVIESLRSLYSLHEIIAVVKV